MGLDSIPGGIMAVHFFAKKALASAATAAFVVWGLLGVPTPAAAQVQTAVEYGLWTFQEFVISFFVTSSPDEIAALDAAALNTGALNTPSGLLWLRTGETFEVWTAPVGGALPTCRFIYAKEALQRDPGGGEIDVLYLDHFYTPYAAECASVQANPNWQYEGVAFYLQVPDEDGNCPIGTTILYRLYSNGFSGGPSHRLTTSLATFNRYLAAGWVFEGDGRTFAFACVPSAAMPSTR
jgi:uncharacterized protein DUF5648